jgi:hypothetical protein
VLSGIFAVDAFEFADDFAGTGSDASFHPNHVQGVRRRRMKARNRIGRVVCREGEILNASTAASEHKGPARRLQLNGRRPVQQHRKSTGARSL